MSRAVLISIRPKWCEKIANGEKAIEVRKTRPKMETPFKCYIYCTRDGHDTDRLWVLNNQLRQEYDGLAAVCANLGECPERHSLGNGKVIGEFACDCITPLYNVCTDDWERLNGGLHRIEKEIVNQACLTEAQLHTYAVGKSCFAWHISNLKIYNEPKALNEFTGLRKTKFGMESVAITRPPQSWGYVEELP